MNCRVVRECCDFSQNVNNVNGRDTLRVSVVKTERDLKWTHAVRPYNHVEKVRLGFAKFLAKFDYL